MPRLRTSPTTRYTGLGPRLQQSEALIAICSAHPADLTCFRPVRICVYLSNEFKRFAASVTEIRRPALEEWIGPNVSTLIAIESELPQLLEVLDGFTSRPRPGCFLRELPISSDSKFIERHAPLLRQWLDRVLTGHAIRADENHFERRYGLRYAEPHLLVQRKMGFPCETVSVPLHTLGSWGIERVNALVVENKVNLLTVPRMERTVGLGALGKVVSLLRCRP